jgi:cytochrome c oxidase subunit 4
MEDDIMRYGYGLLNMGSFLLGLIAWILPIINLNKQNKAEHKNWFVLCITSISACAISLFLQILYNTHLVTIHDWAALMDTRRAVVLASSILLVVTFTLNVITLIIYSKNSKVY